VVDNGYTKRRRDSLFVLNYFNLIDIGGIINCCIDYKLGDTIYMRYNPPDLEQSILAALRVKDKHVSR
jgi:hypothetical protein